MRERRVQSAAWVGRTVPRARTGHSAQHAVSKKKDKKKDKKSKKKGKKGKKK